MKKNVTKQVNKTFRNSSKTIGGLRKSLSLVVTLEKAKEVHSVLRTLICDLKEVDLVFQDYIASELAAAGSIEIEKIAASYDGRISETKIIRAIQSVIHDLTPSKKCPDCVEKLCTSEAQQGISA